MARRTDRALQFAILFLAALAAIAGALAYPHRKGHLPWFMGVLILVALIAVTTSIIGLLADGFGLGPFALVLRARARDRAATRAQKRRRSRWHPSHQLDQAEDQQVLRLYLDLPSGAGGTDGLACTVTRDGSEAAEATAIEAFGGAHRIAPGRQLPSRFAVTTRYPTDFATTQTRQVPPGDYRISWSLGGESVASDRIAIDDLGLPKIRTRHRVRRWIGKLQADVRKLESG